MGTPMMEWGHPGKCCGCEKAFISLDRGKPILRYSEAWVGSRNGYVKKGAWQGPIALGEKKATGSEKRMKNTIRQEEAL